MAALELGACPSSGHACRLWEARGSQGNRPDHWRHPATASAARASRLLLAIQAAGVSGESEASVPAGVWPPGGPTESPPLPKTLANNTFGAASEDGRYGQQ